MWKYTAVLILSSFAAAQQQTQLPDVTQTRLHTSEGWRLRVENRYSSPIVAMHLSINCPKAAEPYRFYQFQYDRLYNYGVLSVAPGASFSGLGLRDDAPDCDGGLDAVLFANGYSNGVPDAVQDIYRRRQGIAEALAFALPLVEQVSRHGSNPADVAKTLRDKAKAESLDASKSTAEKEGWRYALTLTAVLLEKQQDLLVPSDRPPRKQPGIEETMQLRGVTHEQAHAIVLKRKLEEWNADLQGNLDPPSGK